MLSATGRSLNDSVVGHTRDDICTPLQHCTHTAVESYATSDQVSCHMNADDTVSGGEHDPPDGVCSASDAADAISTGYSNDQGSWTQHDRGTAGDGEQANVVPMCAAKGGIDVSVWIQTLQFSRLARGRWIAVNLK